MTWPFGTGYGGGVTAYDAGMMDNYGYSQNNLCNLCNLWA